MTELLVARSVPNYKGKRPLLTKQLTQKGNRGYHVVPFHSPYKIQVERRSVSSFDELVADLDTIKHDRHAMLIRGPLSDAGRKALDADKNAIGYRRKIPREDSPEPWFEEGAVQWEMIDFDKLPTEGIDYFSKPEAFVRHAIETYLPEAYHGVSCWWQYSSSAGTEVGRTSLHLVFWHHQPVGTLLLRAWSKACRPRTDASLYQAVQPHYMARPVFTNCLDPMPRRDGVLRGLVDEVTLPPIDITAVHDTIKTKKAKAKRQKKAAGERGRPQRRGAVASSVEDAMAVMGDGEGLEGFHSPLRDAVFFWTRTTHPAHRNWAAFKERLRETAKAAPGGSDPRVKDRVSDAALDHHYQGARDKLDRDFGSAPEAIGKPVSLAVAEERIRASVRRVITAAEPMAQAILATVGSGKTEQAFREIAATGAWRDKRIHMYVPTNRLSAELLTRAKANGIENARMHRGRTFEAEGIEPLCDPSMHAIASEVEEAKANVRESVCSRCEFFETCGWTEQGGDDAPGLIIMPAEYAFIGGAAKADIQIFDESFWQKGKRYGKLDSVVFQSLPSIQKRDGSSRDLDAEGSLYEANSKMRAALERWDGTAGPLIEAGLTVEIAKRAKAIGHQRADRLTEELKKAPWDAFARIIRRHQKEHATARREAEFWLIVEKELELAQDAPRQLMGMELNADDGVIHTQRRVDLKGGEIPTLVLDATGEPEVLRVFLPNVEVERVIVDAPHQTIVQIDDVQLGKSAIAPAEDDTPQAAKKKAGQIENLARLLEVAKASHGGGRVGLNTYKATEEALPGEALRGVIHDHFGDIAGKDGYREVAIHITVGRPEPAAFDAERDARALWYDSPEPLELTGAFGEIDDWRWNAEGEAIKTQRRAHLDRRVDAIRRQVTTAALLQSDRTRGVRRTAEAPVRWLILTNEPLPLPVHEFCSITDIWPTRFEVAAIRGAASSNAKHMAAMHPDLWATAEVAKLEQKRKGWPKLDDEVGVTSYIRSPFIGGDPNLRLFEYRLTGPGNKQARLVGKAAAARESLAQAGEISAFTEIVPAPRPSGYEPNDLPAQEAAGVEAERWPPDQVQFTVTSPDPPWPDDYPETANLNFVDAKWGEGGFGQGTWGGVTQLEPSPSLLWPALATLHLSCFKLFGHLPGHEAVPRASAQ